MPQASRTFDVAIIGAGIAGASIAGRLAGAARCVILEMESQPGYHTSGRSAAVYVPSYGPPAIRELTRDSLAFYRTPPEGFAETPLLSPRLAIALGKDEDGALVEELLAEGLRRATYAECVKLLPPLRDGFPHYLIDDGVEDIDIEAMLRGFLAMHRRAGGTLVPNAKVERGRREGGVWKLETSAGDFEAPVIVDAAGAWGDDLAKRCGVAPVGLTPKRRSACIIAGPPGADVMRWPIVESIREAFYAKPTGGKLMLSPADADPQEPHDAYADDLRLAEGIAAYQEAMDHEVTRIERSWGGLRTFAPDGVPVVGYDPAAEGFFWCAGQGGYGFQTCPALSQAAAELLLRRPHKLAEALSPKRLASAR